MSELGKPFPEKSDQENIKTENSSQVKMPHEQKNRKREIKIWFKKN